MAQALRNPNIPLSELSTEEQLHVLGLSSELLRNSLRRAALEALRTSGSHPTTARGFTLWSETVAYLRSQLLERGWTQTDPQNQPLITSSDKAVTLLVASGDHLTGTSATLRPNTARRRGPATDLALLHNGQQMFDLGLPALHPQQAEMTWMLLYHWSYAESVIRAELSLGTNPVDGKVSKWVHRILLDPIGLADTRVDFRPGTATDDVDFEISGLA